MALSGDGMNMYKEETVNGNNTKKRRRYEWRAQSVAQEESKQQTNKQTNVNTLCLRNAGGIISFLSSLWLLCVFSWD